MACPLLCRVTAGAPESGTVQEVLHFQTQTIRMMYRIVAEVSFADCHCGRALVKFFVRAYADAVSRMHTQALRQVRSKAHPRDYLNFFCPMKREVKRPDEPEPAKQPPKDSPQVCGPAKLRVNYTPAYGLGLIFRACAGTRSKDTPQPDICACQGKQTCQSLASCQGSRAELLA